MIFVCFVSFRFDSFEFINLMRSLLSSSCFICALCFFVCVCVVCVLSFEEYRVELGN